MSGAFVFTPTSSPLSFSFPAYSPFIPSPSLFPGTPSPYTAHIPLPDDSHDYDPNAGYNPSPYAYPSPFPQYQQPFVNYYPHSLYNIYTPPPPPRPHQLHPWLDGRPDLWFDLSAALFAPMRILDSSGTRTPLTLPDLSAPATHPPSYALHITHDSCPWPMTVGSGTSATPLTLGDVLLWVYRYMQLSIRQEDWVMLGDGERREVGRWWRRRCARREEEERVRGVRRVDYLQGRVLFRGLVVDWGRGVLRMVTV